MQLQSLLWSYSVPASSTRQVDFTFDESAHIGRRFKMLNDKCKSKPVGGRYVKPTRDKILKLLDVSFESYLADPNFVGVVAFVKRIDHPNRLTMGISNFNQ